MLWFFRTKKQKKDWKKRKNERKTTRENAKLPGCFYSQQKKTKKKIN